MSTVKFSVTTDKETRNKVLELKQGATYDELIKYWLDLDNFRIKPKGTVLVEMLLKKWLTFGYEKKINGLELRKWTGARNQVVNKVMDAYREEIDNFNNTINQ